MKENDFRAFVSALSLDPPLANLAPPQHLLPLLLSYQKTGERAMPRPSNGNLWARLEEPNGKKVFDQLRDHIESNELLAAIASSPASQVSSSSVFEDDDERLQAVERAADDSLAQLIEDAKKQDDLKYRLQQFVSGILQPKELQITPDTFRQIYRFSFSPIPLKFYDIIREEEGIIEAVPLLPNCGEKVSEELWRGLKIAGRNLVKASIGDADLIFCPRLRCRLYHWQIRSESAKSPQLSFGTMRSSLGVPQDTKRGLDADHPLAALAACNSLWAARQIFDSQQKGPNALSFWIYE